MKRIRRLWHRHNPGRGPENPTVCTEGYDPARWVYTCEVCGLEAPPAAVDDHPRGGGVTITPPNGWRY